MAENVAGRLALDAYESELMLGLIRNHLEMSAALRRDIFDLETVRAFAAKVQTLEALRMLTLFTYADIQAVHPDALTPWKAENLWRLYLATASYLDRSVDDERVGARIGKELVNRVAALLPGRRAEVEAFLEGFPERYLRTRTPEQVRMHFEMAERFAEDPVQIEFRHSAASSEITLLARDRPLLFADMAGALAAWGMNIVTADAFCNLRGIVVDNFRFTDTFRTLEMNASEHAVFVASVHDVMAGKTAVEKLLAGRRRGRRKTAQGGGGGAGGLRRRCVVAQHAAAGGGAGHSRAAAGDQPGPGGAGMQYRRGAGGHRGGDGDRRLLHHARRGEAGCGRTEGAEAGAAGGDEGECGVGAGCGRL